MLQTMLLVQTLALAVMKTSTMAVSTFVVVVVSVAET
jgi:hypothetical protein